MFDFQQKNKIRKFLYSSPVLVVVVLVACYSLYSTWSIYSKMLESRDKVATAQSQLLALASKNTQLDGEISSLQTNDGVEREIRSKFGVAKPDESMVVIVSDSDSTSSATTTPITFWSRFKHFFGF